MGTSRARGGASLRLPKCMPSFKISRRLPFRGGEEVNFMLRF